MFRVDYFLTGFCQQKIKCPFFAQNFNLYNYVLQTKFGRHIVFAPFLIIITSPRLLLGDVLLFYVSFSLLLLWLLNIVCETYYFCSVYYYYYYYYGFQTKFVRHIVFALFLLIIIIIMAPKRSL